MKVQFIDKKGFTKPKKNIMGFSLIELIVAVGVFAVLAAGVINVAVNSYSNFYGVRDRQFLTEFAQEGIEAVRAIRDNSWKDIEDAATAGANNGVAKDSVGRWQFSGTSDVLNGLTRVVTVANISRGSTGSIVTSGGQDNHNTKKVTVTVSGSGIADYVLTAYVTNWAYNVWEQTNWAAKGYTEYWNVSTTSSTISNFTTSTTGEIKVSGTSAANMVSSIRDIGSSDKELHNVQISQSSVSASCTLQVTLEASAAADFGSPTTQVISDVSTTNYTSTTNDGLNGKRYIRYQLDMSGCSTASTTLYSIKIRYK